MKSVLKAIVHDLERLAVTTGAMESILRQSWQLPHATLDRERELAFQSLREQYASLRSAIDTLPDNA